MSNRPKRVFNVGDTFWFVPIPNRHAEPRPVTITEVGQKWCKLSGGRLRFNRKSNHWRQVDGHGYKSPGYLYDSQEQYEERRKCRKIAQAIANHIMCNRRAAEAIPLDDLWQAFRLLRVPPKRFTEAYGD